jgi:hypothetical protein
MRRIAYNQTATFELPATPLLPAKQVRCFVMVM